MSRLRYISNARTGTAGSIVEGTSKLQFGTDACYIYQSATGVLGLGATTVALSGAITSDSNVGTANTGVTAVERGDGYNHVSVLTVSQVDALTVGDNENLADGYLLYTFPAGAIVIDSAYMSIGVTVASAQQAADAPIVGLGTVIATGAVADLVGTGTFEDIITGQSAANCTGTATVKTAIPTAAVPFVIETGDAHTLHFNVADGWANDTGEDLTADIAGTVVVEWKFLA